MKSFEWIYEHASARFDSVKTLEATLPLVKSGNQLSKVSDDRYLSMMSQRIFRAGLKHSLVDAKWPAFEEAFWGFDPYKLTLMSDEQLESRMQNTALIRHWGKMRSIRHNALFVYETSRAHGGFGRWIANWPSDDIASLWLLMKKQGKQLGGMSAQYFLRMAGKDTFVLTNDVVAALKAQGVIDKTPTSKKDLLAVQVAFNEWHQASARPFSHISKLLAFCVD